jgi:hypothetical protein
MGGSMSLRADRTIGTDELLKIWKGHSSNAEDGVKLDVVKAILKQLCEMKQVEYDDSVVENASEQLQAPEALNFEQFRVLFASALQQKVDLTESLAAAAIEK